MSEQGMAMMGSAAVSGVDRARVAAELAIACPLLEGVNLAGARGVLVNITASRHSLKLRETKEVMNTIRAFASDDATIIHGGVYDDALGEELRVTVIATGLGQPIGVRQQSRSWWCLRKPAPTTSRWFPAARCRERRTTTPCRKRRAVFRKRDRAAQVEALANSGGRQIRHPGFPAQASRLTCLSARRHPLPCQGGCRPRYW